MIDFTLTEEQQAIRQMSREFAQNVTSKAYDTYKGLHTQEERFRSLLPLYREAIKGGQLKAGIPVPLGGLSKSLVDAAIAMEEQYAVDPSLTLTLAGNLLGLMPLFFAGTPEQHKIFLAPFLTMEGEPLAGLVHSEPGGTANWLVKGAPGLSTTAKKVGNDWIVNGTKLWTTNSGGWDSKGADLQCLVARVVGDAAPVQDPESDPRANIIVFLVTRDLVAKNAEGAYRVLEEPELMGHKACSGPKSQFTDFKVPADHHVLAGPGGGGAAVIEQAFGCSSALVGVFSTSIMRHTFEAALKFAKVDKRGGNKPIIEYQSVADILMDVKMRTDACRMMTWKALHAMENGPGDFNARLELCLETKIFCSELAVRSVSDAMRAVGITSYAEDQPFGRWLNNASVLPIFDGGNVGIRRRQIERIYQQGNYDPWAAI